jgi:hypothetical protein
MSRKRGANKVKHEFPVVVAGSSTFGIEPKVNGEKTYNMFVSDEWLISLGGYQRVLDLLAAGEGRGAFNSIAGKFFIAVVNANVYKISNLLGVTLIGQLQTSSGEVFMDENLNQQICIVDGLHAYIYNYSMAPNLTIQADGFLGVSLIPNYVTYHDTFFLFGNGLRTPNGTKWYSYGFSTATTIVEVSDQTFQTKPDYPLAVKRIPGQSANVLVFGTSVCEIHTHIGGTDNYRRNSSVSIDYGCASVSTIAASGDFIGWLGLNESNAPVIMIFSGQQAKAVSTDGIDRLMNNISRPDLSTAYFLRQDGHLFYVLTFYFKGNNSLPADNLTLAYDLNTDKFYNFSDQHLNYHPARQTVYINQDLYFVSLNNASIYKWSPKITAIIEDIPDANNEIPIDPRLVYEMQRLRIANTIRAPKTTPFIVNNLTILIQQGTDPTAPVSDCLTLMIHEDGTRIFSENGIQVVPEGGGEEDCIAMPYQPKIQYAHSKDGGVTFSNYLDKLLNPLGVRRNILKWDRLGHCNEYTPKFRFWGLGSWLVSDGIVTVKPCRYNQP